MSASCRVFVAGEGASDIGDLARHPRNRGDREGFLQPILRKLVDDKLELEFDGRKISTFGKERIKSGKKLLRDHASKAYAIAAATGFSALVYCTDVDREHGRKRNDREAAARTLKLRNTIADSFEDTRHEDDELVTLVALPCRMIEAWALGDRSALEELAGESIEEYGNPEELWGDEEKPDSNHPKCVLRRVLGDDVDFAEIAEVASIDALERACPGSFAVFAADVREAVDECLERQAA